MHFTYNGKEVCRDQLKKKVGADSLHELADAPVSYCYLPLLYILLHIAILLLVNRKCHIEM